MFLKLLLMALVIAGAVLTVRMRQPGREPARPVAPAPAPSSGGRFSPVRIAAAAVVLLMILGTGLFLYLQWRDAHEIVVVRVVDSSSGRSVTYEAYQSDVEGRSFRTLDGRVVTLAEVERMELSGRN